MEDRDESVNCIYTTYLKNAHGIVLLGETALTVPRAPQDRRWKGGQGDKAVASHCFLYRPSVCTYTSL